VCLPLTNTLHFRGLNTIHLGTIVTLLTVNAIGQTEQLQKLLIRVRRYPMNVPQHSPQIVFQLLRLFVRPFELPCMPILTLLA